MREATFQLNSPPHPPPPTLTHPHPTADDKDPQQLLGGPKSRQTSEQEALWFVCWLTLSNLVQQVCLSRLFTHDAMHPNRIPGLALRANELYETE